MTILDHFDIPGRDWCSSADQLASMKQILKTEAMRIQQPTEPQVSLDDLEPPRKRSKVFSFMGNRRVPTTISSAYSEISYELQRTLMHYVIGSNNS